jgi:hypothetical protein
MRQFAGFAELRAFLHSLTRAQEESYREAARAYLASERFDPFRLRTWVDLHARLVSAETGLAI